MVTIQYLRFSFWGGFEYVDFWYNFLQFMRTFVHLWEQSVLAQYFVVVDFTINVTLHLPVIIAIYR